MKKYEVYVSKYTGEFYVDLTNKYLNLVKLTYHLPVEFSNGELMWYGSFTKKELNQLRKKLVNEILNNTKKILHINFKF